jgi:hypothetical protein
MAFAIPAIILVPTLATVGYQFLKKNIMNNYGPTEGPNYKPNDKIEVNGEELTVLGYSGHADPETAKNLKLVNHHVWITPDRGEAQTYAGDNGSVATIAAKYSGETLYSRYENQHHSHYPTEQHKYTIISVDRVTPANDARLPACTKRLAVAIRNKFKNEE